ncbi:unnamed protein product [Closterium sp. NIES-54]
MGRHLATFTRRPGLSLYTLTTEPTQVAASGQVSVSGQVAPPCSCCLLSHQTLLWHHRLGHPSLPRLRGMHSRLLVSGLPRSLPPLPPSPAPPCLPCVEGRQRAAPHSSLFPPTIDPLQTLHMDVWGPARVSGQGRERYFLLVVDDYMRYTTVFPLRNKGEVPDVLIPWIRAVRLQLREWFLADLPILRLRSDKCVMEVARTSTIHAVAPHFLWPFAVRYTVHQLNLWPHVSLPETSPTLRWIRKVGDASVFRGPAPSGVSQVDPLPRNVPLEVAVDSGGVRGTTSGSALSWPEGAEPGGPEPEVAEPSSYESECAGSGGAEPRDTVSSGGLAGALPRLSPRPEPLSSKQLREWFAQRTRLRSGAAGAGDFALRGTGAGGAGFTSLGGAGVPAGAGGTGGAGAAGPGGARTRGTGAAGAGSVGGAGAGGAGAGDTGAGGTGAGGAGAGEAGAGFPGAGGAGAGGTGADDPRSGGAGAGGAASCDTGAGGTVQRRPIFIMPPPSCLPPLVSVLYQAPCELSTTLAALGFAPSTADPSLFLRTDTSLPPFYVLVYVDDLVFVTADTEALALVKSELQKRHTCTDLAPPSDESVEPSRPYPELVGCLMYLMTCTRFDLAYPLRILARYVAPRRHQSEHWEAAKRVLRYLCSTSGIGLVLGGRGPVVLTGHAHSSWVDDLATQRSSQGYTFSLGSGSVS